MPLPTREDINPTQECLDEMSAVQHFLGKDLDQARDLFIENILYYGEDLMWMGPRAFAFYYQAYSEYLKTVGRSDAEEAFGCFATVVGFQMEPHGFSEDLKQLLREDCDFCLNNFDQVESESEYFRDILTRLKNIRTQLTP